jgi:putative ABC transport system permease protein
MLVGTVLAVGIAAYGQTMASSMRETTEAKASVFTGGDVSVATQPQYRIPRSFPFPTTQAYQFNDGVSVGSASTAVGLIAVDPKTLASAIHWYPSFSATPLDRILRSLEGPSAPKLPVVAVGDLSDTSTLNLNGASIPTTVVATATAFPGIFGTKPWIVVDAASLGPAAQANGGSDPIGNLQSFSPTWVRGEPSAVAAAFGRLGFLPNDILTTDQVLEEPAYLAATRTFRILEAIGLASALLAAAAILLYIQARQRSRAVVAALSGRMGLSRQAQMWATFAELASMLTCAIGFGFAIGVAAAVLIHGHADPLPNLPPPPLLLVSLAQVIPMLIGGFILAAVGAGAAQVAADRTNFAEAMRHAD